MTAVKERFMQMIPDIEQNLPLMRDGDVQELMNLWIRIKPVANPVSHEFGEMRKSITCITSGFDSSSSDAYTPIPVGQKQKALEGLMKFYGSIELPEDCEADKEAYLRRKYESLT